MAAVRTSVYFSFLEKYVVFVVGFASSVIIARLLTPAEIGIFSVGIAFIAFAHTLRDFGVTNYLIQERELSLSKTRTALTITWMISLSIGAAIVGFAPLAGRFYENDGVRQVLYVVAVNFFLIPISSTVMALLRRDMRFGVVAVIQVANAVALAATSIGLAAMGYGFISLAWGAVAGSATTAIGALLTRPDWRMFLPSLSEWRKVAAFGGFASGTSLLNECRISGPDLILGRTLGFTEVGLFSRAMGLRNIFNRMIVEAIMPVLLPVLSAKARANEDLRGAYCYALGAMNGLAWPFMALLAILADPLIRFLYGEQWVDAAPVLRWLALAAAINFINFILSPLLVSIGRVRDAFLAQLISVPVAMGMIVIASIYGDLETVAAATNLSALWAFIVGHAFVHRAIGIRLWEVGLAVWRGAAVTVLAALGPLLAVAIWGFEPAEPLPALILGGGLFGLLWLGGIFALRHELRDEIIRALQAARKLLPASMQIPGVGRR